MDYTQELNTLLDAAPEYISTLVATDYLHLEVVPAPSGPPALAWTHYDDKQKHWVINMRPEAAGMSPEAQQVLWRHEVGHIFFAHFSKSPCMPEDIHRSFIEALQVGDLQINYYLQPHKESMLEIGRTNADFVSKFVNQDIPITEDSPGYLDPEIIYPKIGLAMGEYPFEVIHAYVHKKFDEQEASGSGQGEGSEEGDQQGWCAGIESPGENSGAETVAAVIASLTAAGEEALGNKEWGNAQSIGEIRLRDSELPAWLPALESFARSQVEVILADTRSHTRPQDIYAAYNVHMPTMRPRWAYKANTVCLLVDTSGSMGNELQYVMPVVQYLNQHDISVRLIAGDTRVTYDELLEPGAKLPTGVGGGGGTEITPLFDKAYEYEPESMVVFSDGYVQRWPEDPGITTLFVGCQTDVPWGIKA